MLQWIAIIMIAMLGFTMPAAHVSAPDVDAPSVEAIDPEAYRGQWVSSEALEIELFLPEGWSGEDQTAGDSAAYVAESDDGAVRLSVQNVGALDEDQTFEAWAEAFMDGRPYSLTNANGEEAMLSREAGLPPRTSSPACMPASLRNTVQPVPASAFSACPIRTGPISWIDISFTVIPPLCCPDHIISSLG